MIILNSLKFFVLLRILFFDYINELEVCILDRNIAKYCANLLLDHIMLTCPFFNLCMNVINLEVVEIVELI
jgi:hypothetical protein